MMPLGEAIYRRRVAVIQAALADENIDGILLLDSYNVMYAAGFIHIESERPIGFYIPAADAPISFVPLPGRSSAGA